ncbi:MAG: chemotaxis protein CheW [Acidobacteria bacterium]|uniref:Chemotaxis protein CheW n=1 Tax=Candidatus Polarisedimenticola svalbardensis TaxID=2886004 RepID=A0A8J6Y0X9_9BACT|nr:chemotaxis protein CheW [Candidatus Polarisedimenticola svalbardensis]
MLKTNTRTTEGTAVQNGDQHLVVMTIDNEEYGVPIHSVREILRMMPVGRVPGAPEHVRGVINVRGQVMAVVEARTLLGLPALDPTQTSRILVVEIGDRVTGLLVDSVSQVLRIPESNITSGGEVMTAAAEYIRGMARWEDRMIILLDLDKALAQEAA